MSKAVSRGQALELASRFGLDTDWDALDGEAIQRIIDLPRDELGRRYTAFLKNSARLIVGEPKIIPIDRSTSFNPETFIGKGWKIDEEDERSLALTDVDLSKIQLVSMLNDGESSVQGEEKLKRLKASGNVRLDAKVFQTLWENQELIPAQWKEQTNGYTTYVFFDGTVLRDSSGYRCVLCLCFDEGGWGWDCLWLDCAWDVGHPSAVLASQS